MKPLVTATFLCLAGSAMSANLYQWDLGNNLEWNSKLLNSQNNNPSAWTVSGVEGVDFQLLPDPKGMNVLLLDPLTSLNLSKSVSFDPAKAGLMIFERKVASETANLKYVVKAVQFELSDGTSKQIFPPNDYNYKNVTPIGYEKVKMADYPGKASIKDLSIDDLIKELLKGNVKYLNFSNTLYLQSDVDGIIRYYVDVANIPNISTLKTVTSIRINDYIATSDNTAGTESYIYRSGKLEDCSEKMLSFDDKYWKNIPSNDDNASTIHATQTSVPSDINMPGYLPWDKNIKICFDEASNTTHHKLQSLVDFPKVEAIGNDANNRIRLTLRLEVPYKGYLNTMYRGNVQVLVNNCWVSQFDVNATSDWYIAYPQHDNDGLAKKSSEELLAYYRKTNPELMKGVTSLNKDGNIQMLYSLLLPNWVTDKMKSGSVPITLDVSAKCKGETFILNDIRLDLDEDESKATWSSYMGKLIDSKSRHFNLDRADVIKKNILTKENIPSWEDRLTNSNYGGMGWVAYSTKYGIADRLGLVRHKGIIYSIRQDVDQPMYVVEWWASNPWYEPGCMVDGKAYYEAWRQCWMVIGSETSFPNPTQTPKKR